MRRVTTVRMMSMGEEDQADQARVTSADRDVNCASSNEREMADRAAEQDVCLIVSSHGDKSVEHNDQCDIQKPDKEHRLISVDRVLDDSYKQNSDGCVSDDNDSYKQNSDGCVSDDNDSYKQTSDGCVLDDNDSYKQTSDGCVLDDNDSYKQNSDGCVLDDNDSYKQNSDGCVLDDPGFENTLHEEGAVSACTGTSRPVDCEGPGPEACVTCTAGMGTDVEPSRSDNCVPESALFHRDDVLLFDPETDLVALEEGAYMRKNDNFVYNVQVLREVLREGRLVEGEGSGNEMHVDEEQMVDGLMSECKEVLQECSGSSDNDKNL